MRPEIEEKLHKITDAAKAAGEAVSEAGEACLAIAVGQVAGVGATCLDKLFPNGEGHSGEQMAGDHKSGEQKSKKQKNNKDKTGESKAEDKSAEPKAAAKAEQPKAKTEHKSENNAQEPHTEKEPKAENMDSDGADHEALNRKKAEKMAEVLSKSVSTPPDPLTAPVEEEE